MLAVGVDIGGTKCAVCLGRVGEAGLEVLARCPVRGTKGKTPEEMTAALAEDAARLAGAAEECPAGIGISCGGPLDSRSGVILSPPNLPGWDRVPIAEIMTRRTGLPAWLCNDANAGALAEWKFGAGRGASNLVFLTFGTGLGAGLILNGRLYEGASGMAGEAGHIRLKECGPAGYGKMGSFEGFCSGSGIAQLARLFLLEELQAGRHPALCPDAGALPDVTAEMVGMLAGQGDPLARRILRYAGERLGAGLSVFLDLLNPEVIVIGGIFTRCHDLIWPGAEEVIEREALLQTRQVCRVVPSMLAEAVGDASALSIAYYHADFR